MKRKLIVWFSAIMLLSLVTCTKEGVSPVPPDSILVSGWKVLEKGKETSRVAYTFDQQNRIIKIRHEASGQSPLEVTVTHAPASLPATFSMVIADTNLSINAEFFANGEGQIDAYQIKLPFETLSGTISRDEFGRIIGLSDQGSTTQLEYDDLGLRKYVTIFDDQMLSQETRFSYNLQEKYSPGVFNLFFIPWLYIQAFKKDPFPTEYFGWIYNEGQEFMPLTQAFGFGENFREWHFQYARAKDGRITEMRKFTKDFTEDYRIVYSYVNKK